MWDFFIKKNWAHHIDPDVYDANPNPHEDGHVPALRFGDRAAENDEIRERIVDFIMGALEIERDPLGAIEWSLGEIMDNVSNHAKSLIGGFIQATSYEKRKQVEFVVSDAGIGIPSSMRIPDPNEALRKAILEGVTSKEYGNAGNGLFGSHQIAILSGGGGGEFAIDSQNGRLYDLPANNGLVTDNSRIPYRGTSVRCRIGMSDPKLLDKMLSQFKKSRQFYTPLDIVEKNYENDQGELVYNMKQRAKIFFGSREGGRHVRKVIENLLGFHESVIIDLSGVGTFTSSFADEVFGRLFVKYGSARFDEKIKMKNVSGTIRGLIGLAIEQRTKLDNEKNTGPRCRWVDMTISELMDEYNAKEEVILRGKKLAEAWNALEDPVLKHEAFSDIRSRWQEIGWWDDPPQGKSAEAAKAIYDGYSAASDGMIPSDPPDVKSSS